jgi:hypothetical protein
MSLTRWEIATDARMKSEFAAHEKGEKTSFFIYDFNYSIHVHECREQLKCQFANSKEK